MKAVGVRWIAAKRDIAIGANQIQALGGRAVAMMQREFGVEYDGRARGEAHRRFVSGCDEIRVDLLAVLGADLVSQRGQPLIRCAIAFGFGQQQQRVLCAAQHLKEPGGSVWTQQRRGIRRAITGPGSANEVAATEVPAVMLSNNRTLAVVNA